MRLLTLLVLLTQLEELIDVVLAEGLENDDGITLQALVGYLMR